MANYITISNANPFKFYKQSDIFGIPSASLGAASLGTFNPSHNSRGIDNDFYYRNIPKWLAQTKYFQPVQYCDPIYLQWEGIKTLGAGAPFTFYVLSSTGGIVKTVSVTSGSSLSATHRIYEVLTDLLDLEEGTYFFQIKMTGYVSIYDEYFISEPFKLKLNHEGTRQFRYEHSSNDYGIYYETGIFFTKRFYCHTELNPAAKFNVYQNEPMDTTMLSGVANREYNVMIGDNKHGMPEWEIDKFNLLTIHDTIFIDGIQYTRTEGSQIEKIPVKETKLNCLTLKMAQSSANTDLSVDDIQSIPLYTMPSGQVVFIDKLSSSSPSLTLTINKYFKTHEHLLAYLNCVYGASYYNTDNKIRFSIDATNRLVVNCFTSASQTVFANMTANKILDRYLYLKVDTLNNGAGDIIIDVTPAAGTKVYGLFKGDGSSATVGTYSGSTTFTSTYSTTGKFNYYLFLESTVTLLNQSDPMFTEIGGLIDSATTSWVITDSTASIIRDDLTKHCNGTLATLDLSLNSLTSETIENQIIYMQQNAMDGKIDSSLTALFVLQTPSAPPTSSDLGFGKVFSNLLSYGITVTTD